MIKTRTVIFWGQVRVQGRGAVGGRAGGRVTFLNEKCFEPKHLKIECFSIKTKNFDESIRRPRS